MIKNICKIFVISCSFLIIFVFGFLLFGCIVNAQTIEFNYNGGDQITLNGTRYWFTNEEVWRGVFTGNNNNGNPTTDFRLYYPEFDQQYFEIKINIERGFYGLLAESLDRQISSGQIGLHDSNYWAFPVQVYLNNNLYNNVEIYQFCDGRYIPTLNVYCNITIRGEYRGNKGIAVNLHNNFAVADIGVGGGFNFFIRSSVLATPDPSLTTEVFVQEMNQMNQSINNVNNSINDMNNTIKDDSVDDPTNQFNQFNDLIPQNGVITQLIALPITLYQSILNGINSTCKPFDLGSLYGTRLTLPCINIANYIGAPLFGIIDVLISGFFIFSISKKFIKVFESFTSLKEGDVIDD